MRIVEMIGAWGALLLFALLLGMVFADCTLRLSDTDLRIINQYRREHSLDTLEELP